MLALLMGLIFGAAGGVGAALWIRRKQRKQKALSPADDVDAQIYKALQEGVLTKEELIELGINPNQFQSQRVVEVGQCEPLSKQKLITQFIRTQAERAHLASSLSMSNVDIQTDGARMSAQHISLGSGGHISMRAGNVSISIGGDSHIRPFQQPMLPMRPMRPMRPLRPMRPMRQRLGVGLFDANMELEVMANFQQDIEDWHDEITKQEREYAEKIAEWEREIEEIQKAFPPGVE